MVGTVNIANIHQKGLIDVCLQYALVALFEKIGNKFEKIKFLKP
jgi:hypothetical protein